MLRVQLSMALYIAHMMYSLIHLVIRFFSYEYVFFSFLWVCFISFVLMYVMLLIWDIFHLHIMITWAWPIMEGIKSIDLALGDRPREFEIITHLTFWLKQYHIHIHTLTFWTWWPIHDKLCISLLDTIPWPFFLIYSSLVHSFFDLTR